MQATSALRLLAVAVVSGAIGAFAAQATTSTASPQAIAAAVQKVRDTQAEQALAAIRSDLDSLNRSLGGTFESPMYVVQEQLFDICQRLPESSIPNTCPGPATVLQATTASHRPR
jgi:hypothetical protein